MADSVYFYADASKKPVGPFSLSQLLALVAEGVITPDTKVIAKGDKEWVTYSQYMGFLNGVDYVFLIDSSSSMAPCFEPLKLTMNQLLLALQTVCLKADGNRGQWRAKGTKWRAKMVGYRNFRTDAIPLMDNPFTDDQAVFNAQLNALKAEGGGDGPRSLLEAIYHVATMGQTEKGESLSPDKWQTRCWTHPRMVIVFTDAPCYETMDQPKGGTFIDVANACHSNVIHLRIIAPEMECYDSLGEIDKSDVLRIEYDEADPEGFAKALRDAKLLTSDGLFPRYNEPTLRVEQEVL